MRPNQHFLPRHSSQYLEKADQHDSSTSIIQIEVKYDGVDDGIGEGGKSVKMSNNHQKPQKLQKPEKVVKTIGSE